jgi:deazaflavin-dependent oxidoreductase (nitroreductase family)
MIGQRVMQLGGRRVTMTFEKSPSGTRGARVPSLPSFLSRFVQRAMVRQHRRKGDTFQGMDVLYLTTTGAKNGQKRQTPVAHFADGDDALLIVASAGGAARHPAWYHNIAAHPDQVWIEVGGRRLRVVPEQLDGQRRDQAWQRITASQLAMRGTRRTPTASFR